MTNFNSGFNPNFNPNFIPNQGLNRINPYANTINQPFIHASDTDNNKEIINNVLNKNTEQQPQIEQTANKNIVSNYENVKMDSDALLKYLQNIMKMPENINKLINTLDSPIIKALIGKNIDVKILSEIMKENSTKAVEKVLKAISESLHFGAKDVSQLKDVLGILNTIQNTTSNTVIKELLLLYIPVNPPIFDKNVEFSAGNKEEKEAIENSEFCLIFETVNFSNISCCIKRFDNTLYLDVFTDKIFPFEKFKKVVDNFKKEMNLRIETENKIVKRADENNSKTKNFNVISSGFVPCDVLILAHLIIKAIFKIDDMAGASEETT